VSYQIHTLFFKFSHFFEKGIPISCFLSAYCFLIFLLFSIYSFIKKRASAPSIQEAAAYCLKCIACRGDGELAVEIGGDGATHSLMRLLPHSDGRMQKVIIKCFLVIDSFFAMQVGQLLPPMVGWKSSLVC